MVRAPSCHEVAEGKQQTCAKRVATEGVSGNPFPGIISTAPEVRNCLSGQQFPPALDYKGADTLQTSQQFICSIFSH